MRTRANFVFFVTLLLCGCVSQGYQVTPPSAGELSAARAQIVAKGKYQLNGLSDEENLERLNRVAYRLRPSAETLCRALSERSGSGCAYAVYYDDESPEFNAYATESEGENRIIVTMELLRHVHSDDELALVLGHEVGHHLANHFADQSGFTFGEGVGLILGAAIASDLGATDPNDVQSILRGGMDAGGAFDRPAYNRQQESEADLIGIKMLVSSGYAPNRAINLLLTLGSISGDSNFLSSHPSGEERVASFVRFEDEPAYHEISRLERQYTCRGIECIGGAEGNLASGHDDEIVSRDAKGLFNDKSLDELLVLFSKHNMRINPNPDLSGMFDPFFVGEPPPEISNSFWEQIKLEKGTSEIVLAFYYEKAFLEVNGFAFTNKGIYIKWRQKEFIPYSDLRDFSFEYKNAGIFSLNRIQYINASSGESETFPSQGNHVNLYNLLTDIQKFFE